MDLLSTAEGQLITAAAMIDDIFSLILLSMLTVVQAERRHWIFLRPLLDAVVTGSVCWLPAGRPQCRQLRGLVSLLLRSARGAIGKRRCFSSLSELAPWQRGYPRDSTPLLLGIFSVGAWFCTVRLQSRL